MDTNSRKQEGDSIISSHAILATGAGLIPIPIADIAAVTGIQLDMIIKLTQLYGQSYSETQFRSWITALVGGIGSRLAANAIKLIPGVGTIIGGISMAALSGASTYAIGKVFLEHYERGGTSTNFSPDAYKDYFKEQFSAGKDFVEKNQNKEQAPANDELILKLQEVAKMKENGVITEEEFKQLKEKIISQYI